MRSFVVFFIVTLGVCLLLAACAGNSPGPTELGQVDSTEDGQGLNPFADVSWPSALPVDSLQPWEALNADGFAIPAESWPRNASSLNLDSDFTPGVERHLEGGDVSDFGEASSLASGDAGNQGLSYAIYRVLGGGTPLGIVTADVNLHQTSLLDLSEYWLGVADYGKSGWSWHGPFKDSHVRLQMPDGNHSSSLGNHFVCVVAYDGAAVDVVGIGVNGRDVADVTAPAAPASLVHSDFGSSTLLEWMPVADSDIAGYQVYYHHSAFVDANTGGLRQVTYLVGDTKFLLTGLQAKTYVRVATVDISGNESEVSEMARCTPLVDASLETVLEVDTASGMIGDMFNLTANGGDTYDFDLDGDGTFDVMGNVSGIATLNATQTGIIRPLVRANSLGGMSIAMGAVSLVVAGNSRPVVQGFVDPAFGVAPLTVQFTSNQVDIDGDVVEYIWDFTSDGGVNFRFSTAGGATDPPLFTFTEPGLYNAKVRAWDDKGAWDVDTVTIHVKDFVGFDWMAPDNHAGPQFPDFAIVDGNPAFTYFNSVDATLYYIRATNPKGTLWGSPQQIDAGVSSGIYSSLAIVKGVPAVAYLETVGPGLNFLIADDPQGASWSSPRVLVDPVNVSGKVSLEIVDGNPAIGYATGGHANYIRSDSIDGFTWGNAPVVVDSSGGVAPWLDLEVIDGNPAMAYLDAGKAQYMRATTATGTVAGDWADPRVNVSGVASCGGWVSLENVNGRPAISYYEVTGTNKMAYHRALNSTGQTGLDWPAGFITVETGTACGQYATLGVVNGVPVVGFFMVEGMLNYYYCSATNSDGTDWNSPIGLLNGFSLAVGDYGVILEHDGGPYIGCANSSTNKLFFARPIFE